MSKVYILVDYAENPYTFAIKGVITNKDIAIKYRDMKDDDPDFRHDYAAYEIDDPELLNRIAKESEMKK